MRQFFPRNTIFIIFLVITLSIFSPLLVRASLYQPGETLNPDCTPGSPNCGVVVGVGFSQGGNSFGTPADLGTNDNYALNFRANSSTVLTILPSGNVGIGTTTPANKLDVNGGVRVVGNLEIGSFQPAASGNLQLFQGSGYYGIQSYNNWPLAINPLGNNVGIGTTTPETKLSVVLSGNQYVNISGSNLVIQSSNATGALIQVTGTGAADLLGLYDNNNPALVVKDGGYVGIGTSNPNQRLDVSGRRILLGSNVGDEGFGRTDGVGKIGSVLFPHRLNSEEPISGMILYSNTANRNDLYFGGGVENIPINAVTDIYFYTASNPTTLTGTERMHITSTGRIGIGTSSPVATLSVMGTSSDPTLNPFVVASSTGLDLFVVSPSGNVGIGTPPQALISEKLAVQGTIIAKDWTTAGYPNLFVGDDVFLTDLDISNTMGIYGNSDINQAHLRLGATGITLSGVNDKLGVGTTTPADKLDVAGKIQFNSMAIARSGSLGVLPSSQTGLYFGYDSGNDRAFFASGLTDGSGSFTTRKAALFDYATFLFTRDGSNADMFISSLGRIGIGTTSPVTSLFVQGKPGVDPFFVASATGTSLFTVNQTGNVGVGIQNPQAKLQVALGDILVSSAGATAGTPLVDSGSLILRGAYWNGSQSIDVNSYFKNVVLSNATSSPNSQLEFYVAGERVASLRNISNPPYPEPARDFRVYGATGVPAIFSLIAGNGTDYADYTYNGADA